MCTYIYSFISLDDNPPCDDYAPFDLVPSYWDLRGDFQFCAGKDYRFFAAIAGVCNDSEIEPLYPLRGLPKISPTDPMRDPINEMFELCEYPGVGWLTLFEIEESLRHMRFDRHSLHESTRFVLDVMSLAVNRLGNDRVRLIFGFS